jgi:type VI secretion system protein ImpC
MMPESDTSELMDRTVVFRRPAPVRALQDGLDALTTRLGLPPQDQAAPARRRIEAICAEIDRKLSEQINLILHHPEFQALEAGWRGLQFLVLGIEPDATVKVRVLDLSRRELGRSLRKFRGTAWDQSPLFKKIYEEEYGQFGGEPFGVLIGDYAFDHRAEDVQVLQDVARIAAAAHTPFIAAASPAIMQMDSWAELANPRDLTRIFQTPEYVAWRALREGEDARFLGLCLPRFLARVPYGARTDPVEAFSFEEAVEGPDARAYLWANAAFALGANIARAFQLYGWCTRIRGVDSGGTVEGLPVHYFATADGEVDMKSLTEVALSERREAELARAGFIALVHRKNTNCAAFISAQSLQRPVEYDDPAATANAVISARLPYIFASCRFAHYLKCMVRDKVGSSMSRAQLQEWLGNWLTGYVDGSPHTSTEEWKASHPLEEGRVVIDDHEGAPGQYDAKFFLRPHYQLEGLTVALRLVSRLPAQ